MSCSGYTLSVPDVVALEELIQTEGIPLARLMRSAGEAVAQKAAELCKPPAKVVVFCGSGNNGGDGWVAAETLALLGYEVNLISTLKAEDIRAEPAASTALEVCKNHEARGKLQCTVLPDIKQIESLLDNTSCIIDALLGAGFSGDLLRKPLDSWVQTVNSYRHQHPNCKVLSVDTPSGLSAQTGATATPCITADITITMLVRKPGLLAPDAQAYCGELILAELIDLSPYCSWIKQHAVS